MISLSWDLPIDVRTTSTRENKQIMFFIWCHSVSKKGMSLVFNKYWILFVVKLQRKKCLSDFDGGVHFIQCVFCKLMLLEVEEEGYCVATEEGCLQT